MSSLWGLIWYQSYKVDPDSGISPSVDDHEIWRGIDVEQAMLFSALDQRRLITVTIKDKEDVRLLHRCWCRQQLWPATTLLPKLLLLNMGSELRCHLFREAFPNSLSGPLLYAFLGRCSVSLFHLSHCAVTPPFVGLAVSCRSPLLVLSCFDSLPFLIFWEEGTTSGLICHCSS